MLESPSVLDEVPQPSSVIAWPSRDPEWKRLADAAARLLYFAQDGDEFDPEIPRPSARLARIQVARHRAYRALLALFDLAPEWTRATVVEPLGERIMAELLHGGALSASLDGYGFELPCAEATREAIVADLPEGMVPVISDRLLPIAVSTLAAARAHAILLATAGDPARQVPDDALPVADVIFQGRALLALAADGVPIHPCLMFAVAEAAALCSLASQAENQALNAMVADVQATVATAAESMLAQNALHGPQAVNGVALAYCAAVLALPPNPDIRYVDTALIASAAAQQPAGLWADGRRVVGHQDPDSDVPTVLSTYDVALAVAEALSWRLVASPDAQAPNPVSASIQRAVMHAGATIVLLSEGQGGWAAEQTYGRRVAETNATSSVLRLVVTTRRVAEAESAALALSGFDLVWHPRRDPVAPYLVWDRYRTENEPDAENPILPSLDTWFVKPIREHHLVDRRPWSSPRGHSLLLFGPPGTTKTTIVKAMAQGLGWPLVTLSPGTFIRDGLEHVERRAIHVFGLLEQLSGVVVLFDECDELFRSREHTSSNDNDQIRSISAFMTASMLPKLQDLRDRERIVFVIATNYFEQIDSAVKRIGRIDHKVGVGWPDAAQRRHMISTQLAGSADFTALPEEIRAEAIRQLTQATRYCIRGDIVQLASKLGQRASELQDTRNVEPLVESLTSTATKVSEAYRAAFVHDAGESSETHKAGRGEI